MSIKVKGPNGKVFDAKYCIVTICGSSRFVDIIAAVAWLLETKEQVMTMSIHFLPAWYTDVEHHYAEDQGIADDMDALHIQKVGMSDAIFVVDWGGYIGDSTALEISFAEEHGIEVRYLSREPEYEEVLRRLRGTRCKTTE